MHNLDCFIERLRPSALGKPKSLYATYYLTRMCLDRNVAGDFVECGVYAGAHPAIMAYACMEAGQKRLIHLFDSFQGIPHPSVADRPSATDLVDIRDLLGDGEGELITTGVSSCSRVYVERNMRDWGIPSDLLVYHEGWFQETVPKAEEIAQIAILRLDGDLYESTKVCMQHLYPKVNRDGGWCIVDDYHLRGCRQAITEYFDGGVPGVVYWIPEAV